MNRFYDFISCFWPPMLFMALVVGFILLMISGNADQYTEFMTECRQENPQYVCTAMWRGGRR